MFEHIDFIPCFCMFLLVFACFCLFLTKFWFRYSFLASIRGCILICYLNLALSTSNWNSDSKIWYIFDMNTRNIISIEHRAQQNVADIHCIWHWVNYYSCCSSRLSLIGYSRAAIPKNYFSVQESKHWLFPFDIFG